MTVRGRSPNLRFEFPATWPPAILVVGSLCTPRDRAGGKGPLSRRDAVAKLPIWGLPGPECISFFHHKLSKSLASYFSCSICTYIHWSFFILDLSSIYIHIFFSGSFPQITHSRAFFYVRNGPAQITPCFTRNLRVLLLINPRARSLTAAAEPECA